MEVGKHFDLVAWDIPSNSRTVLWSGGDGVGGTKWGSGANLAAVSLSPDGKSLLGIIFNMRGEETRDVDIVVWDVSSKLKTALVKMKGQHFVTMEGVFSRTVPFCGSRRHDEEGLHLEA